MPAGGGDHHLAGLDLADELGADDVEGAGLGGEHPAVADLPEHQRADAERVADADQLGAGHGDDREGALDAAQRVLEPFGDGLLDRAGHQVDDALGVGARLEDRAVLDQLLAQAEGVGQVAVVGDGAAAHGELGEQRLDVADLGVALGAGGRVADVADGERAGQRLHQRGGGEAVADVAEAAGRGEALGGAVGDDAGGLLAAMLQRVQAEGDEARGVLHADHAEDAALLAQLVVVERGEGRGIGLSGSCRLYRRAAAQCHDGVQLCVSWA